MEYKEALDFLIDIMLQRPRYIIGGSMALIIQGSIPERTIGDFDFCVNVAPDIFNSNADSIKLLNDCDISLERDYLVAESCDYVCYKIDSDRRASKYFGNYCYYNLFLRIKTSIVEVKVNGHVLKVQNAKEIWHYKQDWLRDKDKKDIFNGRL